MEFYAQEVEKQRRNTKNKWSDYGDWELLQASYDRHDLSKHQISHLRKSNLSPSVGLEPSPSNFAADLRKT